MSLCNRLGNPVRGRHSVRISSISDGRADTQNTKRSKKKKKSGEEKELREKKPTTEDVNLISYAGATFAFPQLVSQ